MKLPVAILIPFYVFALPTSHAQTNAARTGVSPTASAQESHLISIMRSGSRQPSTKDPPSASRAQCKSSLSFRNTILHA